MPIKFLQLLSGGFREVWTIATSAGAADADKIPSTNAQGVLDPSLLNAKSSSAGSADAGKIAQLDGSGRLDVSMMPVGVDVETAQPTASEALSAGNLVNIYNNAGVTTMRKADAATNKPAHGWVKSAVASGATGVVFFEGRIAGLAGLTAGDVWLGANGACTSTPPTAAGSCSQKVGTATSATEVIFERHPSVLLA